jgi:hypothetical protein
MLCKEGIENSYCVGGRFYILWSQERLVADTFKVDLRGQVR